MKNYLIAIVIVISGFNAYSQNINEINKREKFKDICVSEKLHSTKLFKTGNPIADPVITLNSGESVTLVFDEIIGDNDTEGDYYYTIEHRDADWGNTENLIISDYLAGFTENRFNIINHSQGSKLWYRNFYLTLPNNDIRLKISGNYVIKVFERGSTDPVLIKGFSVLENNVTVNANIMPPIPQLCMQQINLRVMHQILKIQDPFINLKVRVEQNSARIPDTRDPTPAFTQQSLTDYTRPDRLVYKGLNEYRSFDIRSLTYNGQGVSGIRFANGLSRVDLGHDLEQTYYVASPDINGKYAIASDRTTNPDIQSEYAEVRFSLAPQTAITGRIFLFGEFTNYSLSEKYEMLFKGSSYTCSVLLKQGYYNYKYVVVSPNGKVDMHTVGGCFYETENAYNIYVYYRTPGDRYDRLVGFSRIITRQN